MSHKETFLAFIGGSGLYDIDGITNLKEHEISTPFGSPSDKIIQGELNGRPIAFLPRHGRGHRFLPSEVNYRANIYALKKLGVSHIVSVCAVGSLQEELPPGMAVIPTQIFDRTAGQRKSTFFGEGVVGHISFAEPFCHQLQSHVRMACEKEKVPFHFGGTYIAIEGPRFSTKAESLAFRKQGADIIGMTAMPEAILAREAEIPYATLAFVTDYDCWREEKESVTVEMVLGVLKKNVEVAKQLIVALHGSLPASSDNPIFSCAQHAIMTPENLIPSQTKNNLELLYQKYWDKCTPRK